MKTGTLGAIVLGVFVAGCARPAQPADRFAATKAFVHEYIARTNKITVHRDDRTKYVIHDPDQVKKMVKAFQVTPVWGGSGKPDVTVAFHVDEEEPLVFRFTNGKRCLVECHDARLPNEDTIFALKDESFYSEVSSILTVKLADGDERSAEFAVPRNAIQEATRLTIEYSLPNQEGDLKKLEVADGASVKRVIDSLNRVKGRLKKDPIRNVHRSIVIRFHLPGRKKESCWEVCETGVIDDIGIITPDSYLVRGKTDDFYKCVCDIVSQSEGKPVNLLPDFEGKQ